MKYVGDENSSRYGLTVRRDVANVDIRVRLPVPALLEAASDSGETYGCAQ